MLQHMMTLLKSRVALIKEVLFKSNFVVRQLWSPGVLNVLLVSGLFGI